MDEDDSYKAGMALLWLFAACIAAAPLRAVVMVLMWRWFVVPLGMPELLPTQAFGIDTLISMFRYVPAAPTKDPTTKEALVIMRKGTPKIIAMPLMTLAFGWAAHWFMVQP